MARYWVALRRAMLRVGYNDRENRPVDAVYNEGDVLAYVPGIEKNRHFKEIDLPDGAEASGLIDGHDYAGAVPLSSVQTPELVEAMLVETKLKDAEAFEKQVQARANAAAGKPVEKKAPSPVQKNPAPAKRKR